MVAIPTRVRVTVVVSVLALAAGLLTLALMAKPAQAQGVEVNDRTTFESGGQPLCGGEEVVFRGTIHSLFNITEDEHGGVHVVGHTNFQQMEASGVVSGDRYVISDINNMVVNESFATGDIMEFTQTINGRLIHTGEDGMHTDDTLFHATFHFTLSPDGELIVTVENIVVHCD
jgi:hypothetical protein